LLVCLTRTKQQGHVSGFELVPGVRGTVNEADSISQCLPNLFNEIEVLRTGSLRRFDDSPMVLAVYDNPAMFACSTITYHSQHTPIIPFEILLDVLLRCWRNKRSLVREVAVLLVLLQKRSKNEFD
jgi:hypothetical protein